jgi:hypothetical protein
MSISRINDDELIIRELRLPLLDVLPTGTNDQS